MQMAKKIRIYPTEEQKDVLWNISEMCRIVYNFALADKQQVWSTEKRPVRYVEQANLLPDFKERNPEFKVVYSKVYQVILSKLDISYKSTLTKWKKGDYKAKLPKFKSRKYIMNLPFNQSGFTIKDGKITFSHYIKDAVPLTFDIGNLLDGLKIKQVEISNDNPYKARGKFYITVTYDEDILIPFVDNGKIDAIDIGITKAITSVNTNGEFTEVKTSRPDKYWNPKIDKAKSRRDNCLGGKKGQKKSNKYLRIAQAVRKMSNKKTHQINDFLHKLTTGWVNDSTSNTFLVGALNVPQMAQPKIKNGKKQKKTKRQRGLNRSTQGLGNLSKLAQLLTYKSVRKGKQTIRVDEKYTSRMCSCCGKIHEEQELKDRVMLCDCGNVLDRDRNSAINIMVRYFAQNALWTGYQQFVGNLQHKGIAIYSTGFLMELRFLESKPSDKSTCKKPVSL
jgi:putative transposase